MKYTFTDIDCEDFEQLELCSSHYRICWQESYAGRLSKIAMNELLEQSGPGELESWLIGHGKRALTVVNHKGNIIGSVASNCLSDRCYVWGMYILQKHQRAGIGSMLLERVIQRSRELGSQALEITVLESSSGAIEFYKKNGFIEIDRSMYEIAKGTTLSSKVMELKIN